MNIRKTIIVTAAVVASVAVVAPNFVGAATIDELLAQIAQLQSQLTSLQGGAPVTTGTGACAGVTFSRNLTVGSTGSDVKCLQVLLNNNGFKVATTGAGSPGAETTTFGPKTLAAVKLFQAAKGFTPANQVGPMTRGALNALLGTTGGTVVVPTGAGLSVVLATNSPAAGTIVNGQSQAALTRITFVNGDSSEVKVTGLKLKRTGVSADASLTNVYLFDGAVRLTDGASVSSTVITFNSSSGLFTVPAGSSKTITVSADISGTAGETVGVQVVAGTDVTSNASSIKGVFPVSGNLMTIATGTLAGVSFATTTTPSSDASVDPQDGFTVWQNSTTVSTRAVDMTRISFRKTGSVANTDLKNLKLYVDGVQVGSTMQLDSNGYVTFDLTSSPKRLEAGTRVIKVLADIVGGSSLNFVFNLWNVADVTFVDSQYGANVLAQANSTTFSKRYTGTQTVNSGTITITKLSNSPSGTIVDGATNATLAKFELKAAGEKVKIETLYVSAVVSTSGVSYLRNGALYANGVQIGSTSNLYDNGYSTAYTTFNLGSSLIVEPGSPVTLEVRADIYDNDGSNGVTNGTTIAARIEGDSSWNNATGLTSSTTIDAPSADVTGNTLTVGQGGLTLSKLTSYTDRSVVAPLTAYKLGHFTLTASTTEAVNVSAINVALNMVSSYTTNLYVKYGTQTTTVKPTVSASNTWSINYVLPAGQTIDVEVYGDVSSLMTTGTAITTVDVDGTTASSAVTADSTAPTGQTLTFTSGSFATATVTPPDNQVVAGNQAVVAGTFKLTSSYQQYKVTEMRFTANSNSAAITSASLYDGTTLLSTMPYDNTNAYFNFTGLNVVVPASTSKSLTLKWNLANVSYASSTSDVDTKAALTYVKYEDTDGAVSTDTNTRTANTTLVYASVPTLAQTVLTSSTLQNAAEKELYKFTVTAPTQGPVSVKQFKVSIAWTDGGTADSLELESLKLLRNGSDITSSVTIMDEDGSSVESTTGVTEGDDTIVVKWDSDTESEIAAGTSVTYTIKGTPQGFGVNGATDTAKDTVALDFAPDSAAQTATYNYINIGTSTTTVMKLYSSATANGSAANANLIWSDQTAIAHSASTTAGTGDWSNSYLINDIGSQSWSN
jgi:peptidoglycan hydrolase-like protein with peptidoglycan-binding domain